MKSQPALPSPTMLGESLSRFLGNAFLQRQVRSGRAARRPSRWLTCLTAIALIPLATAQPLGAPFDTKPFNAGTEGSSATSATGFLPHDGTYSRILLGTDLSQGRLVLDFAVPFTDGPGDDFAVQTAPFPDGAPAPRVMIELFLGGALQAAFPATLAPARRFTFDLPGTGLVADRIVITNITPDPAGANNLGGVAIDDVGVAYPERPAVPAYVFTDLGPSGTGGSAAMGINARGDIVGYGVVDPWHAFLYSRGTALDLGAGGGGWRSGAFDVNDDGIVVGTSEWYPGTSRQATIWAGGTMVGLSSLGGPWTEGSGINNLGEVVGTSATSMIDSGYRGFLFTHDALVDLGTLGGSTSRASAINDVGQITGSAALPGDAEMHAFLYSDGHMLDLGSLGGGLSYGAGINASGEVVGTSLTADYLYRAFLYANGTMLDLGTVPNNGEGIPESFAFGVNRRSEVVGESTGEGIISMGFLYAGGTMHDVNGLIVTPLTEPWHVTFANAINDAGQIVGTAFNRARTVNHAMLLSPIVRPLVGHSGDNTAHHESFAPQRGTFVAVFDAIPSTNPVDAVVGFANGVPAAHRDLAVIVRFNAAGTIDARNWDHYSAQSVVHYTPGATYHFRLMVDVPAHRYSAFVTPPAGPEILLAANYNFRVEQRAVQQLDTGALIVESTPAGGAATMGSLGVAGSLAGPDPLTVAAADGFRGEAIATQTGTFQLTLDTGVSRSPLDGVIGLSSGPASAYTDLAAIVRFNPAGMIDARNGSAYAAASPLPYAAGLTYRFRMLVNVATHRYSVYVTPPGRAEVVVGENFAFRSEQAAVTSLSAWNVVVDPVPARAAVSVGNSDVISVALP